MKSSTAVMLAAVALTVGCQSNPFGSRQQTVKVTTLRANSDNSTKGLTPGELNAAVMRFSDEFCSEVGQASEDLKVRVPTPEARAESEAWKLTQCASAIIIATGPNPTVNALDLVVLATLSRMVQEDYWVGEKYGDAARPLLEAHRLMETNAWALVAKILDKSQQGELQKLIQEWRAKNPHQRAVAFMRLRDFADALGEMPEASHSPPHSLFSLFFLDPMAGLDPAARSFEQTRQLAERTMFYFQRLPGLLSWQMELLSYRMALQPEARQILSDVERLTKTAEQMPQVIAEQRQAAIDQVLGAATNQEAQLKELLPQLTQTFAACNDLMKTIHLMSATDSNAPPPVAKPPDAKPFDINDYTKVLAQAAATAQELTSLANALNQNIPQVKAATDDLEVRSSKLVNRAFLFGEIAIFTLLIGAVIAGLTYRRLARK